jgi:hypothetical protein
VNGTVCAVLTSKAEQRFYARKAQILCYGTLRGIGKISVKNAKRLIKNGVFR